MRSVYAGLRGAVLAGVACLWLLQGAAWCEEGWRAEFEAACSRTTDAMELSPKELDLLIGRLAALEKVVQAQEESVRKVYLKRLALCRNLYAYVLEYKKKERAQD